MTLYDIYLICIKKSCRIFRASQILRAEPGLTRILRAGPSKISWAGWADTKSWALGRPEKKRGKKVFDTNDSKYQENVKKKIFT